MDCETKTIKHCKICHTSFFSRSLKCSHKSTKILRVFINKLQVRTKASMTSLIIIDRLTCDARTCCWRWKGSGAPVRLCEGDGMLLVSIELTPPEETAASMGPIPAAMFEKAPPMLN